MSIKKFIVLLIAFGTGLVVGSIITLEALKQELEMEKAREEAEQDRQIGV